MAAKFKTLITGYCTSRGITIPPGYGRNSPNRFAVVRIDLLPPKLIATTWFKVGDVLDYIENQLDRELGEKTGSSIQILDFKTGESLAYTGKGQLQRIGPFAIQEA